MTTRRFKIIRFYESRSARTIKRGSSIKEAKIHVNDPETSSRTATGYKARRRTKMFGAWFDGYTVDR